MILKKYTAPWCVACKTFGATVAAVLRDFLHIELVEVDVSVSPTPGITSLPTLEFAGRRVSGVLSVRSLRNWFAAVGG